MYCLSNCQEYIKAKAQNLISDKVCLDTTHQRFKVFNGYRLEAEATVILLFQNRSKKDDTVDRVDLMVSQLTIWTKKYYFEK